MKKYIIFDLDGTLTDPAEGITKSVAYALSHFGIEAAPESLTSFIGPPLYDQFALYTGFAHEDILKLIEVYRERFRDIGIFENYVLDGVPEMLAALKKDSYILAIASSKPEVFCVRIMEKYRLAEYFDVVCGSELDGTRVKKAEVIKETLARLARIYPTENFLDRSYCLMVGDRIHDVEGAAACGMDCVGVTFGFAPEGELEASDAVGVISDWKDLWKYL